MTDRPSKLTRVRRRPDRAAYDRDVVYAILDEALTCHVGFVRDSKPIVIPTIHARRGDTLYLHGSPATGFVRDLGAGVDVCVSVSVIDGLVMARSAMHHSMNYRSVVAHGTAHRVTDETEMLAALEAVVEHVVPGRWPHLRPMRLDELRQTSILSIQLDEASAKIRTGPPADDEADHHLDIWAGVLPVRIETMQPETDADVPNGVAPPSHVTSYQRRRSG